MQLNQHTYIASVYITKVGIHLYPVCGAGMSVVALSRHSLSSPADSRRLGPLLPVPVLPRRERRDSKVQITISSTFVSLGWWMVMSEDEQGYAPAAYLEPVEGRTSHDHMVETENSSSSEGEDIEQYLSSHFSNIHGLYTKNEPQNIPTALLYL